VRVFGCCRSETSYRSRDVRTLLWSSSFPTLSFSDPRVLTQKSSNAALHGPCIMDYPPLRINPNGKTTPLLKPPFSATRSHALQDKHRQAVRHNLRPRGVSTRSVLPCWRFSAFSQVPPNFARASMRNSQLAQSTLDAGKPTIGTPYE